MSDEKIIITEEEINALQPPHIPKRKEPPSPIFSIIRSKIFISGVFIFLIIAGFVLLYRAPFVQKRILENYKIPTKEAWDAMQKIGGDIEQQNNMKPSELLEIYVYNLSMINTDDVDPELTSFLKRAIYTFSMARNLLRQFEYEIGQVQKGQDFFVAMGGLFGAAAADDPETGLVLGSAITDIFSSGLKDNEIAQIKQKYSEEWETLEKTLLQLVQEEKALAKKLSSKYELPFIVLE